MPKENKRVPTALNDNLINYVYRLFAGMWDIVNYMGSALWWAILPAYLLLKGKNDEFGKYVMALAFSGMFAMALKYLFLVPRVMGIGPAFPSFHAQTAFIAALLFTSKRPRIRLPLIIVAIFASAARIGLGYHTPLDVVGGMFIGTVLAFLFANMSIKHVDWIELRRQAVHFLGIILIPLSYYAGNIVTAAMIIPVAGFVLWSQQSKGMKWTQMFQRKGEKSYRAGALFVLSLAAALIVFPWEISSVCIVILCAGDSFAAVIGKHFHSHQWWFNKSKSIEGSIAFAVVAYPLAFIFIGRELAVLAVLLAALVEALPLNDNISIPVIVGAFLTLVRLG